MSLITLNTIAEIDAQRWDSWIPSTQPFLRHAFLSSLEDSGCVSARTGWQSAHRLLLDAQGQAVAAMPAYVKAHSFGEYVFDQSWAEACMRGGIPYYPKLLGAVPFTPVSGPRLLGAPEQRRILLSALTAEVDAQGLSGMHINFSDESSDMHLRAEEGWLERLGCQFHWHNRGYRDFADFLDAFNSRRRKNIRKERELSANQGIRFDWRKGSELSEAEWDFVYDCYANTYVVRGRTPYLTRQFFSLLAERMPEAIRVVLALHGNTPVAMALSLVGGDTLYGRHWGCLANFDSLHFETCFYQGLDLAMAEGLQHFNAGAQGEHKLIRGFEPELTRSWHYLKHPGLRRAVADFLREEHQHIHSYLDSARGMLPYKHVPV